ncbi:MAG: NYN domain-containing protein, partial [Erysipelotrichaceae bacterium]|nr:NYN domain-containing protein [Erysipelotrichaceae bacterium]
MHYSRTLDEMADTDFFNAREKVINMVCDFAGYVNAECILVFDAYKNEDKVSRISKYDNITLVYTRTKQTADEYIEIKSKELSKDYKVIVVTSDALEQLRVFASGASRMSSREFYERYERFRKDNRKTTYKPLRPFAELKSLLTDEEE